MGTTTNTLQLYLGEQLAKLAEQQALGQQELADRTNLGRTTISKLYGGKIVKLAHYTTLASALGQDIQDLIDAFDASNTPAPNTPALTNHTSASRSIPEHYKLDAPVMITVASRKGGTGKTTTCVSLAACLARQGYSVAVVDLDGQANSTYWLGQPEDEAPRTIVDVFTTQDLVNEMFAPANIDGVWLMGASGAVDSLDARLTTQNDPDQYWRVADRFASLTVDFVIFDTPADFDLRVIGALLASRWVLIPVEASAMGVQGLHDFVQRVNKFQQRRYNPALEILGMMLVRADNTIISRDCRSFLRDAFPEHALLDHSVRSSVRYRECYSYREPITDYDARAARDYVRLTRELLRRMGLSS